MCVGVCVRVTVCARESVFIGVYVCACVCVCIVVLTWFTTSCWIRLVARVPRGGFLSLFVVFLVIINNYIFCISVSQ